MAVAAVTIATVTGLVGAPPAPASPSRAAPQIAGVTTIRASRPGSMLVRLPDGLGEPGRWELKARFRGAGRVMAFVFLKEEWTGRENRRPMLVGQKFGDCTEVACAAHPRAAGGLWGIGSMPTRELPGGLYRLYVVTDGAPVTMTLIAPGLDGRITLTPTGPAQVEILTLTPIHELLEPLDDVTSRLNLYWAGTRAPFEGRGYAVLRAWWRSDVKPAGMFGHCSYDEDPPVEAIAYLPSVCRTHVSQPYVYPTPIRDGYGSLEASYNYLPAAMGFWNLSAAPTNEVGAVTFWLETP